MSQVTHEALCKAWQPSHEEYGALRRAVMDFLTARKDGGFWLPGGKVAITIGTSPWAANASDAGVRVTIELVEIPLPGYGKPHEGQEGTPA